MQRRGSTVARRRRAPRNVASERRPPSRSRHHPAGSAAAAADTGISRRTPENGRKRRHACGQRRRMHWRSEPGGLSGRSRSAPTFATMRTCGSVARWHNVIRCLLRVSSYRDGFVWWLSLYVGFQLSMASYVCISERTNIVLTEDRTNLSTALFKTQRCRSTCRCCTTHVTPGTSSKSINVVYLMASHKEK